MIREQPVTAVQAAIRRRGFLLTPVYVLVAVIVGVGVIGTILGVILLWQLTQNRTPHYVSIVDEFKYGSIGAETHSGIPYRIWRALPSLFPEAFAGRDDYSLSGSCTRLIAKVANAIFRSAYHGELTAMLKWSGLIARPATPGR